MKELLKSIYPFIYLFFCFVIPLNKFAPAVPNISLILLLAIFSFIVTKRDLKKILKKEFVIFLILVFYILINSLLFQDFTKDLPILLKIGSSLVLLILFIPIKFTQNLHKTIIIAVLYSIIISLYNLYWFYMEEGTFNFSVGSYIDEVLIIDRFYIGILCVLSIVASIGLIGKKYNVFNKWYFANIVLCVGFIFIISTRFALVLLVFLFLLNGFYTKSKKEYLLFFFGVIIIIIGAFSINKNLNKRFFYSFNEFNKNQTFVELFKNWETRVVIWKCNYSIIKNEDYLLKGNGFYGTKDLLANCYESTIDNTEKQNYFLEQRFNSHNQFVDFLISTGILGVALFILFFIALILKYKKSYFKTSLIFITLFLSITENIFHRQLGAYIFTMILLMILFPLNSDNTINEKN